MTNDTGPPGRQICILEATDTIISAPPNYETLVADPFAEKRQPYDAGVRNFDNLSLTQPMNVFSLEKLSKLAVDTGLSNVVRWKPRMVSSRAHETIRNPHA